MPNKKVINNAYTNPVNGLSYTNKDFNSIYNEQLDLVKELTDKWDPSMSNESDPGVVLLKENAILADKENYNIDKNVLELFPASVSQYGNARQLYDSLGYEMHWYRSATTSIYYKYSGSSNIPPQGFKIPNFTMVSDSSGYYVYTLINPTPITEKDKTEQAEARQGIITDFEINGDYNITLNYLDSDLRLYFPDTMVAENGIFIASIQPDQEESDYDWTGDWKKVSNLESSDLGQKIYSFGVLPNSNTCYIQFPQDIADLIGSGLRIKYLVTMGQSGNVSKRTIDTLYSDLTFEDSTTGTKTTINDDVSIINFEDARDGEDPEDLESAYHNYKKTVGTFNTLVTCRDYENGIYNLEENGKPLASNAVVSDRTNDINNSYNIVTLTTEGHDKELYVETTESNDLYVKDTTTEPPTYTKANIPNMTAFDLGLYVLQPMGSNYTANTYAQSFSVNNNYVGIKQNIEDSKSVQHDYIETAGAETPFIIKNVYDVVGKVITYYKVTEEDAKNIEQQIILALYKRFNARNIDFGEPIDYDTLVQTIQSADSRIKSVIVNEPQYVTYVMYGNDYVGTVGSTKCHPLLDSGSTDLQKQFLTGLIGNGNVQLYNFNADFEYEFGQININTIKKVSKITSEVEIDVPDNSTDAYEIRENENVILTAPSYITETSYTYHVQYKWTGSEVKANTEYEIQKNESLALKWDGDKKSTTLGPGKIIKSSIKLTTSTGDNYKTLGQTDSIDVLKLNVTTYSTEASGNDVHTIKGSELPCCWFLNNPENVLFDSEGKASDITERILDQNEYFIYSNGDLTDLVILGSGTKISTESSGFGKISFEISQLDIDKILSGDTFNLDWQYPLNRSSFNDITFQELQMIILESGVKIYQDVYQDEKAIDSSLVNKYQPINEDKSFYYLNKDSTTPTTITSTNTVPYEIRSRLNIASSLKNPQKLVDDQSFAVTYNISEDTQGSATISGSDNQPIFVKFNYSLAMGGGDNLDFSIINTDGSTEYPVNLTYYNQEKVKHDLLSNTSWSDDSPSTVSVSLVNSANTTYTLITPDEANYILSIEKDETDTGSEIDSVSLDSETGVITVSWDESATSTSTGKINVIATLNEAEESFSPTLDNVQLIKDAHEYLSTDEDEYADITENTELNISFSTATQLVIPIIITGDVSRIAFIKYKLGQGAETDLSSSYSNTTYYIDATTAASSVSLNVAFNEGDAEAHVLVGKVYPYTGYANTEILSDTLFENVKTNFAAFKASDSKYNYDYSYKVPETDLIEDPLSPESFWDSNNPYNRFTIAQMRKCDVKVISSSKL